MHVNSIVGGDGYLPRRELDDESIRRAGLIVVGYKPQILIDKQAEFADRLERGIIKIGDLHELGELVTGKCRGRKDEKEITLFKNNTGMGIQFAATARLVYEKAKEKGIGTELPLAIELRAVPDEVAARVPQTKGYQYVVRGGQVLLVSPPTRIVVGLFSDAP